MLSLLLASLLLTQDAGVDISFTRDAAGIEYWVAKPDPAGFPRFFREFERLTNHRLADPNDLPFAQSVAVLVGVSKYPHADIEDLDFVRDDIRRMREYLLSRGAFDRVIVLLDDAATTGAVEKLMMTKLRAELRPEDRLLFYFSGHGLDANGVTGYLAFKNAAPGEFDPANVIPVTRVYEWSRVARARHVLFILDSCSSGLGYQDKEIPSNVGGAQIDTLARHGSRIVITAGTANERTIGIDAPGGGSGSAFTLSLLRALEGSDAESPYMTFLTAHQVFSQAEVLAKSLAAMNNKHLTPRIRPLAELTHDGTFLFLNPKAAGRAVDRDIATVLKATPEAAAAARPPQPTVQAAKAGEIVVRLDAGAPVSGNVVLDVGAIANEPREVTLQVVNPTDTALEVQVQSEGDGISAHFAGRVLSAIVTPGSTSDLVVRLDPTLGAGSRVVRLMSRVTVLASITVVFRVSDARVIRQFEAGDLTSGIAAAFSPVYQLCSQPPPPNYKLVADEFWLTGDRRCGEWASCTRARRDDSTACWDFALQGHSEAMFDRLGVRESEGHLRVTFELVPSMPRLRAAN